MAVLRIHKKQQNFVILDKTCIEDKSLSWSAKGLHGYLISLPDDWKVRVSDLKERAKDGRDAVRGILKELEQAGYIIKSKIREESTGRFGGVEYLVLETPDLRKHEDGPETESPVSVENGQKTPLTEKPSLGNPEAENPLPANTTLINNNKLNNKKLSNKTAAIQACPASVKDQNAAAVISPGIDQQQLKPIENLIPKKSSALGFSPQEDALIGSELTASQKARVHALVRSLNWMDEASLVEEIEYCLMNEKHFTACGKDFGRKLNAIRLVILRGDWQTPAGMVRAVQENKTATLTTLQRELREAYAEMHHFQKLLDAKKEPPSEYLEPIVEKAKQRISEIEKAINRFNAHSAVITHFLDAKKQSL